MPEKFSLKSLTPHLIAAGIFLVITVAYFSPVIFGGKKIVQSDIMQATGMSKEIADFRKSYNEEPYWSNAAFAGMPAYQISAIYVAYKLENLQKIFSLMLPHPVRYIFICFIGFYFLLQVLKIDPWLSVVGALAFGLSSWFFIFIDTGHNSKMAAISYMAPVLAGIIMLYRGKLLPGLAATALFLSMQIFCNHPQITYYLGFIILLYVLSELFSAWKEKKISYFLKRSAVLGVAAIIALGVNITGLWATADFSKYTIRGASELTLNPDGTPKSGIVTSGLDKDYVTQYSYAIDETMTLLIPNFKGGSSSHAIGKSEAGEKILSKLDQQQANIAARVYTQYFGDQPIVAGPVYLGAIILFLFVLGLFVVKGALKWALVFSTLLSVWLAWGKNDPFGLTNFMLDYFPAYNKFRAVTTTLVIACLTIPLLGILAIDSILKTRNFLTEKITLPFKQTLNGQKILILSFSLTGGIALLCWIAPEMFNEFSSSSDTYEVTSILSRNEWPEDQIKSFIDSTLPAAAEVRKSIMRSDSLRSFLFILLAAALIWLYAKNKIVNRKILVGAMIVLILADMIPVDRRYLNNESFENKSEQKNPFARMGRPHAADLEILKDKDPNFRVWNTLARPDQDGITSYFHKSLGGYSGAKLRRYQELIDFHINRRNMAVINMLNTKYFIFSGEKNNIMTYPNPDVLGNAWFVNEHRIVANPDSEITALSKFDPKTTAIVDKRFEDYFTGLKSSTDSTGTIKLTSYKANDLMYETNTLTERLAVFSEIYYANGWNAYLDGKLTPHIRVNYVLRAMRVPAGKHKIEYKFEPTIIATGEKISTASMILLFLLCGGAAFIELKKGKKDL
ncbi:MAG: hypothetical protein EPN85_01535 [Bacteroidetes bacterium]|nr:MAG: hypothetical protein EPN85_01535 [Bacteroidota bacterium]